MQEAFGEERLRNVLHVFHHVFRALNQNDSLEGGMLAHDSAHAVHPDHKLDTAESANKQTNKQKHTFVSTVHIGGHQLRPHRDQRLHK